MTSTGKLLLEVVFRKKYPHAKPGNVHVHKKGDERRMARST